MIAATISNDLFSLGVPVLEKCIRTVAVYGGIVLLLRLAGKRDLAQVNTSDLVVLLLLSNVVQNAIIGDDNSLVGGILGAVVLITVNAMIVRFARHHEGFARLFEGKPSVLAKDGKLNTPELRALGLRDADVVNAIRRQGANTVNEVEEATLESGGSIVVKLRPQDENATKGDIASLEKKLQQRLDELAATFGQAQ